MMKKHFLLILLLMAVAAFAQAQDQGCWVLTKIENGSIPYFRKEFFEEREVDLNNKVDYFTLSLGRAVSVYGDIFTWSDFPEIIPFGKECASIIKEVNDCL